MFKRKTKTAQSQVYETVINPIDLAEQHAARPVQIDDERLPELSPTEAPALTREEMTAEHLASSASDTVLANGYAERGFVDVRRISDEMSTAWGNSAEEFARVKSRMAVVSVIRDFLIEHVDTAVAAKRRVIGLLGKAALTCGDTSVFASILYLSGTPFILAIVAGMSSALTLVGTGSQWGKEEKHLLDRNDRGPAPTDMPGALARLFLVQGVDGAVEASTARRDHWRAIAVIVALGMFVAFTAMGIAVGDPAGKALAAGLLASLSVLGSAALEAYSANEAADVNHEYSRELAELIAQEHSITEYATKAAGATQEALTRQVALEHLARAAGRSTRVLADRTIDTPYVFGYLARPVETELRPITPTTLGPLINQMSSATSHTPTSTPVVLDQPSDKFTEEAADEATGLQSFEPTPAGMNGHSGVSFS